MKIGVLSDIHGNGWAFGPLFDALEREGCERVLFLGDLCGYYYDQVPILERLMAQENLVALAGNHDVLFLEALEDEAAAEAYRDRYGKSFDFLRDSLEGRHLDFLRSLPLSYADDDLGIAAWHGSPWDPVEGYVYPDDDLAAFDGLPHSLVFLGHTHRPMDVRRETVRIVNPGSAGQPRDGGWPSYAVCDTEADRVEIRRVGYDPRPLIRDVERRGEKTPYLVRVLERMEEAD